MKIRVTDPLVEEALTALSLGEERVNGSDLGPLLESPVIISPRQGGALREDGTIKLAIIRPCMSRGRKVMNLPPVYTPRMLERCAGVFKGWPQYMDHLTEGMVEAVKRRNRSISELGGRITESYWDPKLRLPDDDDYGYRPGGVVGVSIPQPAIRSMLEADPEILQVSIHGWPTGARPGPVPWDPSKRGALIEGISPTPRGSVDWVVRGGAGGRVLQEDEERALALVEAFYDSPQAERHPQGDETVKPNFNEMSDDEIREWLEENHPDVYAALTEDASAKVPAPAATTPAVSAVPADTVTRDDVIAAVAEAETRLIESFRTVLTERDAAAEDRAGEIIQEREHQRELRDVAHEMIRTADGLTPGWRAQLREAYAVLPSGPTPALLVEAADDKSDEDVLREDVTARIEHALGLIRESAGTPTVRGQGTASTASESPEDNVFMDFMREATGEEEPDAVYKALREAVRS